MSDFEMFTEEGNRRVQELVDGLSKNNAPKWRDVYNALEQLAENSEFSEAADTAVCDRVFDYLDYQNLLADADEHRTHSPPKEWTLERYESTFGGWVECDEFGEEINWEIAEEDGYAKNLRYSDYLEAEKALATLPDTAPFRVSRVVS